MNGKSSHTPSVFNVDFISIIRIPFIDEPLVASRKVQNAGLEVKPRLGRRVMRCEGKSVARLFDHSPGVSTDV